MSADELEMRSRRAVVFGVDGVRFDTLCATATPHIDAVAAAGFLAPVQVNPAGPTISGPCWSTVATGVLASRHRVFDNDLRGHRIAESPDFLTRIRLARPTAQTYAAAGWPPLVREADGGPVFLGGGYLPFDPESLADWDRSEQLIAEDAAKVLGGQDIAAAFIYFGAPDEVAHEQGVCPDYTASIERADARIGQVLDAIRARPTYADESWTVVVVTDHGHVDAGGHGGDTPHERTAWIAASGPTVPAQPLVGLEQADIHSHVLAALGITIDPAWQLAGLPFDARLPRTSPA